MNPGYSTIPVFVIGTFIGTYMLQGRHQVPVWGRTAKGKLECYKAGAKPIIHVEPGKYQVKDRKSVTFTPRGLK